MSQVVDESEFFYAGLSGVRLGPKDFDLGGGLSLRQSYAHVFSTNMMAFAPRGPNGISPPPWAAAEGGFSYDMYVELCVPNQKIEGFKDARDTIWWIAALLRLAWVPHLTVPIIAPHPIKEGAEGYKIFAPYEIERRFFSAPDGKPRVLSEADLKWIKEKWRTGAVLLARNPKLESALRAFDYATIVRGSSGFLLGMWGAIEELFAPARTELRFRVAALLASYLTDAGPDRQKLYKDIAKLYDARSAAAHSSQNTDTKHLTGTYVHARNALLKMIDEAKVPTQEDLEAMLFQGSTSAGSDKLA